VRYTKHPFAVSRKRRSSSTRRQTNGTKGSILIEQAIATLVNNQAVFVAQLNENNKIRAEADLLSTQARKEADLRFSRIEKELEEIKATLQRHDRVLANLTDVVVKLPDAVSRKIGFKVK
jgi:hypothetical protein